MNIFMKQKGKPPIEFHVRSVHGRRPKVMVTLSDGWVDDHDIPLNQTSARKLARALLDVADALELETVHEA
jgi:hypothetical protein